jgi:hypothetical protein
MRFNIVGPHAEDRSLNLNAQETVNWIPILAPEAKYDTALIMRPGLVQWYSLGTNAEIRNMLRFSPTVMYAVIGSSLYSFDTAGTGTLIGGSLSTSNGHVYMEHDGRYIMVVDPDVEGYYYDTVGGGNLTAIADTDFPVPAGLTWQDTYFIVPETSTAKKWISNANDPTTWDATDFTTVEGDPDNLLAVKSHKSHIWNFGEISTEIYYNSGASAYPLERIAGGIIDQGIHAPASVAEGDFSLFWLDDRKMVLRAFGFQPQVISTRELEQSIQGYSTASDARGWFISTENRGLYFLNFPTGNTTWVYDVTTKIWHEWRSYPYTPGTGKQARFRGNCYVKFAGKHLIGDRLNGKIYYLDWDTYADDSEDIIRVRTTGPAFDAEDRNRLFFSRFEIEAESGVGIAGTGQGSDPEIMLQWSDDGGHTWSNVHTRKLGKLGEYGQRTFWDMLGSAYDRRWRFSMSDPVRSTIQAAFVDAQKGTH